MAGVVSARFGGTIRQSTLAPESLASLARRGIVQPKFIHTLVNERLAEHPGYFGEMVWILMMLEQWLQRHAPDYCQRD